VCAIIAWALGRNSFKLNPEKGLLKQGLLWVSLLLPVSYCLVFGSIAWAGYEIDISSAGLSTFFRISTIPLTVLSLALPLTVLVSRFYSTEQTARQIAITLHKNNLDSFYSHRSELFSYFDRLQEADYFGALKGRFNVHPRVHKNFFKGRPDLGVPEINLEMFNQVERALQSTRFQIDYVLKNKKPENVFSMYMLNACVTIHWLSRALGLPEIYKDIAEKSILIEVNVKGNGKEEYLSVGKTTDDLVAAYRYANDYFRNLCDFSGHSIEDVEEEFKYIETGGKFRTINVPGVVEELHRNEISKFIKKNEND
tara:strand:+ start:641 stop:1573 length:933 start_codon:yes stop_codon:yes gene_type:complete